MPDDLSAEIAHQEIRQESERLTKEHWKCLCPLLELIYHDAFVHGFKHGLEYEVQRIDSLLDKLGSING